MSLLRERRLDDVQYHADIVNYVMTGDVDSNLALGLIPDRDGSVSIYEPGSKEYEYLEHGVRRQLQNRMTVADRGPAERMILRARGKRNVAYTYHPYIIKRYVLLDGQQETYLKRIELADAIVQRQKELGILATRNFNPVALGRNDSSVPIQADRRSKVDMKRISPITKALSAADIGVSDAESCEKTQHYTNVLQVNSEKYPIINTLLQDDERIPIFTALTNQFQSLRQTFHGLDLVPGEVGRQDEGEENDGGKTIIWNNEHGIFGTVFVGYERGYDLDASYHVAADIENQLISNFESQAPKESMERLYDMAQSSAKEYSVETPQFVALSVMKFFTGPDGRRMIAHTTDKQTGY